MISCGQTDPATAAAAPGWRPSFRQLLLLPSGNACRMKEIQDIYFKFLALQPAAGKPGHAHSLSVAQTECLSWMGGGGGVGAVGETGNWRQSLKATLKSKRKNDRRKLWAKSYKNVSAPFTSFHPTLSACADVVCVWLAFALCAKGNCECIH